MQWDNEDKVLSRFLSAICVQAHQDMTALQERGKMPYVHHGKKVGKQTYRAIARLCYFYYEEMPQIVKEYKVAGISRSCH